MKIVIKECYKIVYQSYRCHRVYLNDYSELVVEWNDEEVYRHKFDISTTDFYVSVDDYED